MWTLEFVYVWIYLPLDNRPLSTWSFLALKDTQTSARSEHQIFCLFKTTLKDLLQLGQSKSPIVNSVLFPALSGRPAIFQLFLGLATSAPQFLHLAIHLPPLTVALIFCLWWIKDLPSILTHEEPDNLPKSHFFNLKHPFMVPKCFLQRLCFTFSALVHNDFARETQKRFRRIR